MRVSCEKGLMISRFLLRAIPGERHQQNDEDHQPSVAADSYITPSQKYQPMANGKGLYLQ
jgi:hypothetical protein